jgi:hypothetical protein
MPLVVVPENLHNPEPGIRFLRIDGQMRMRIAKSPLLRYAPCVFRGRSQEYEDQKESQSDRPTTRLGVTADWIH